MTNQELYDKLIFELDRSIVLTEDLKKFWLKNYRTFPVSAVEFFLDELFQVNRRVDTLIARGLEAHPELAEQINQKGQSAKKKFLRYLESQESKEENPEEFLKQSLT